MMYLRKPNRAKKIAFRVNVLQIAMRIIILKSSSSDDASGFQTLSSVFLKHNDFLYLLKMWLKEARNRL